MVPTDQPPRSVTIKPCGKNWMLAEETAITYAESGFSHMRNVLNESDLTILRDEWKRLWSETETTHPFVQWRGHVAQGSTADRIDAAYILSPQLDALCRDPRITRIAEAALGGPAVFFKDKLITKSSGTSGYGLHQDWAYWAAFGVPADDMVTLEIAIDSCDAINGALEVWPKVAGLLPPRPDGDPRDVDPERLGSECGELMELEEGDVLLLHPLSPHRSAANLSDRLRRAYFITYVSAVYEDAAKQRERDFLSNKQQAVTE